MRLLRNVACFPWAVLCSLLCLCSSASADEAPDFSATTLTGDWGGSRTQAWQDGLQLEAGLRLDSLRSRGDGFDRTRTVSHLDLKFRADLDRLFGWQDTVAYLNVLDDRGAGPSRDVGNLMGVTSIEVPAPTTRIFQAWVQKGFFDDRFSLLAGIYPIDTEFFVMESASALVQPIYGTPADLVLTDTPSIFNNAAFGLRGKWYSADRTLYAMGAVLDGVPNDPRRPKATAIKLSGRDGVFAIAEMGWMPLEQAHAFDFEPTDPANVRRSPQVAIHEKYGGTAKYAVGLWGYGRRKPDLLDVDASGDPRLRRSHGGYLLAERTLFGLESDTLRNLTAFGRYTFADPNTIAIDRSWNVGLKWRGPLADRPQDSITVAWTRGQLADKYRQTLVRPARSEQMLELAWRVELSPWLAIQPDYQYIKNPGGEASAKSVRIIGARFDLVF